MHPSEKRTRHNNGVDVLCSRHETSPAVRVLSERKTIRHNFTPEVVPSASSSALTLTTSLPGIIGRAAHAVLRALAVYARSSARYLAAIDSIAKRARYIAMLAGRTEATVGDVRKAMQDSIIPADTRLLHALENGKSKPAKTTPASAPRAMPAQEAKETILPRAFAPGSGCHCIAFARRQPGFINRSLTNF